MKRLGDNPILYSIVGNDIHRINVENELRGLGISTDKIMPTIKETPQSIILYDKDGKRKILVDLKDIQESKYPSDNYDFENIDLAVVCNANFSRELMRELKKANKIIATDVHVIRDLYDSYNKEFIENADIFVFKQRRDYWEGKGVYRQS